MDGFGSLTTQASSWQEHWRRNLPKLNTTIQYNNVGIPTAAVGDWIDIVAQHIQLGSENPSPDPVMEAIHMASISSWTSQITSILTSAESQPPGWLEQQIPTLVSYLWSIRSTVIWLIPLSQHKQAFVGIHIPSAAKKISDIADLHQKALSSYSKIADARIKVDSAADDIDSAIATIEESERSIASARAVAESAATAATEERQKAVEASTEIRESIELKRTLFDEFEGFRSRIDYLLEGAAKIGLAQSFSTRRKSLEAQRIAWIISFALGIIALLALTIGTSSGYGKLMPVIRADGTIDAWQAAVRLLFASPLIWWTWFCGRQFGVAVRVLEDYAFKEAAALAFFGFKNEMVEDTDMLNMLREAAIRAFGANPVRLTEKSAPSSPVHDLVERALDKRSIESIAALLKREPKAP